MEKLFFDCEKEIDGFRYFCFKPHIHKLFLDNFQKLSLRKRIRFSISAIRGSQIIYMRDTSGVVVGYCLLEPGGGRYQDLNKNDLVISPYVIRADCRGMGYGTQLISGILTLLCDRTTTIYAMVRKDNNASIAVMNKVGFNRVKWAQNIGLLRHYVFCDDQDAEYIVFASDLRCEDK